MSIQGVPVSESAGKFPKLTFHLIKIVAVTQTRTCRWFSGGLWEPAILNFFLIFALQGNIVILRSTHRYGEYWGPHSKSDWRYFGSYVIKQIIKESTHIQGKSATWLDLICASQPNLVICSGIHSFLHQVILRQIVFAKFILKVYYPPPSEREVWHLKKANTDHIKRAINEFPWWLWRWWWWWRWWIVFVVWLIDERRSLISSQDHCQRSSPSRISDTPWAGFEPAQNLSSGFDKWICTVVITTIPWRHFFNKIIKNPPSNFTPHETITLDDRGPPWINSKVKYLINEKNAAYKNHLKNDKSSQSFAMCQYFQNHKFMNCIITKTGNDHKGTQTTTNHHQTTSSHQQITTTSSKQLQTTSKQAHTTTNDHKRP